MVARRGGRRRHRRATSAISSTTIAVVCASPPDGSPHVRLQMHFVPRELERALESCRVARRVDHDVREAPSTRPDRARRPRRAVARGGAARADARARRSRIDAPAPPAPRRERGDHEHPEPTRIRAPRCASARHPRHDARRVQRRRERLDERRRSAATSTTAAAGPRAHRRQQPRAEAARQIVDAEHQPVGAVRRQAAARNTRTASCSPRARVRRVDLDHDRRAVLLDRDDLVARDLRQSETADGAARGRSRRRRSGSSAAGGSPARARTCEAPARRDLPAVAGAPAISYGTRAIEPSAWYSDAVNATDAVIPPPTRSCRAPRPGTAAPLRSAAASDRAACRCPRPS